MATSLLSSSMYLEITKPRCQKSI